MNKDNYVNKLYKQQSNHNKNVKSKIYKSTTYLDNDHKFNEENNQQQSNNNELCNKIKHFTEEMKEKFTIKKKTRSPIIDKKLDNELNNKLINKSNKLNIKLNNNYESDEEQQNRLITRIKINTDDELINYDLDNKLNFNLSKSLTSSTNLSPFLNSHSLSQISLNNKCNIESRSPFQNRALPPLPSSTSNDSKFNLNNNKRLEDQFSDQFSDEQSDDDKLTNCFKISKDFHKKSSNQSIRSLFNQSSSNQILSTCKSSSNQKKNSNQISTNKFKNFLTHKKYSPPHCNSNRNKLVKFDDDESEDEDNHLDNISNQTQSLINLNSNLISKTNLNEESTSKLNHNEETRKMTDYAKNIEIIKDCGWYFGSITGAQAEQLLKDELEGSFLVRDSSDENYIFSLAFKAKDEIIHVRIEHDQGNFSFGCLQRFSSSTIVDFITEAVEYSRTGRFLFFLHRLPVVGPMRVQLLYPISRFKNVQSLKCLCRFTILKCCRRDLIPNLPLPDKLKKYLNVKSYLVEMPSC